MFTGTGTNTNTGTSTSNATPRARAGQGICDDPCPGDGTNVRAGDIARDEPADVAVAGPGVIVGPGVRASLGAVLVSVPMPIVLPVLLLVLVPMPWLMLIPALIWVPVLMHQCVKNLILKHLIFKILF